MHGPAWGLGFGLESFSCVLKGSHRDGWDHRVPRGWTSRVVGQKMLPVPLSPRSRTDRQQLFEGSLVIHVDSSVPCCGSLCKPSRHKSAPFPNSCFLTTTRAIPAPQGREVPRPHCARKKKSYQSLTTLETPHPPTYGLPSSLLLLASAAAATLLGFPSQLISCVRFAVGCDSVEFLGS